MRPSTEELRETVRRMERRLRSDPQAAAMLQAYDQVSRRFDRDLEDERDGLLSRGRSIDAHADSLKKPRRAFGQVA
jgi:hypothetical protein